MSDSINNTAQGGNATPAQGDNRTFSQDDVNRIVSERLAKEKTKNEAELVKKEAELAQRELTLVAKELLSNKGLPVELYEALNLTSKEAMEKSISIIQGVIGKIERPQLTFKGAVPATGGSETEPKDDGDANIREAMGLPKK